jgi:acyl carrier protein
MSLISALEEAFDIMMDTDDIIDFSSYEKGKEILKKYDVEIE